jgi:hypothetical protein
MARFTGALLVGLVQLAPFDKLSTGGFMTMTDSPITSLLSAPPTLVKQWVTEVWHEGTPARLSLSDMHIATEAARWGADQELEACCEWLEGNYNYPQVTHPLRTARRPKPPSLKEQALERLELAKKYVDVEPILRAIEQLPDAL